MAREKLAELRTSLAKQPVIQRRRQLQALWLQVLNQMRPQQAAPAASPGSSAQPTVVNSRVVASPNLHVERVNLSSEDGLQIPVVLLWPAELIHRRNVQLY